MMPIGQLAYAARDPTAGSTILFDASPFVRSRNILVTGPADPDFEAVLVALRVYWRLETMEGRIGRVISALQAVIPAGVRLGLQLFERQLLQQYRSEGMVAQAMLNGIASVLAKGENAAPV